MGIPNNKRRSNRKGKDEPPKRRRFLDPTALARGMSSRCIGARVSLSILKPDEIERDLRHMEAYSNACTAYSQQFFMHHNRALVQSGTFGPVSAPNAVSQYVHGEAVDPLPVRIDPEEEKRVRMLRKRIATSEAQREILETEYMSLRSHYVFASQRLRKSRKSVDGQIKLLQSLTRNRAKVLGLRRARCGMARDILACLERRNAGYTPKEEGNITDVWADIESQLFAAEKECQHVPIPEELRPTKTKKQKQSTDNNVIPWDCRLMPRTPFDVPVLLSQMSSVPDKTAAWGMSFMN